MRRRIRKGKEKENLETTEAKIKSKMSAECKCLFKPNKKNSDKLVPLQI